MTVTEDIKYLHENLGSFCEDLESMEFKATVAREVSMAVHALQTAKNQMWSLLNALKKEAE